MDTAHERAERLFRRKNEGKKEITEHQVSQEAVRQRTQRLRTARLERDAKSKMSPTEQT